MTAVPLENGGPGRPLRIVSFGEVLFDIFDDGARLGGAPLNLAVHLHRLGAESLLVSAVGRIRSATWRFSRSSAKGCRSTMSPACRSRPAA